MIVHRIEYADYLCPRCYPAAVRFRRLQDELGDRLSILPIYRKAIEAASD